MPYLQRIELDPALQSERHARTYNSGRSIPPLAPVLESESTPAERRKYFTDESHRKEVILLHGRFRTRLSPIPVTYDGAPRGLQFDLMYYYDRARSFYLQGARHRKNLVCCIICGDQGYCVPDQGNDNDATPVDSSDID
ncbi:hypothetical protein RHS01_00703 [Rhizoctonia solani]|uniref:Uncharacterized protein n=1 Tax=Rhizoctonia solani TaxID=456999 RepID=A0A8H7IL74_9AGAM|nr:hypothetical protein RHS01_00703 [Rhizoctonia solani]